MVHNSSSSADGFYVSQVIGVGFGCQAGATVLTTTVDGSVNQALNFAYNFYGTSYTEVYIGSNGYLTFGSPDTDFTESVSDLRAGPPRIAVYWDDLNPGINGGGQISFSQSGAGTSGSFAVCWDGVPEFLNTGANTFRVDVQQIGVFRNILCSYGNMTSTDGLVGVTPGGNLGTATLLDVTGPTTSFGAAPLKDVYELFDGVVNPQNLAGEVVEWHLDTGGNVVTLYSWL